MYYLLIFFLRLKRTLILILQTDSPLTLFLETVIKVVECFIISDDIIKLPFFKSTEKHIKTGTALLLILSVPFFLLPKLTAANY